MARSGKHSRKSEKQSEFGLFSTPHYRSVTRMLDDPLGKGKDIPTGVEAILMFDFREAVRGNKPALLRLFKRLMAYELAQMRAKNSHRETYRERENEDFERIDDVLELLGIVIERTHRRRILVACPGPEEVRYEMCEESGPGLADWAFEAARSQPDCPKGAASKVSAWISVGCPGGIMRPAGDNSQWSYADDED